MFLFIYGGNPRYLDIIVLLHVVHDVRGACRSAFSVSENPEVIERMSMENPWPKNVDSVIVDPECLFVIYLPIFSGCTTSTDPCHWASGRFLFSVLVQLKTSIMSSSFLTFVDQGSYLKKPLFN